MFSSLICAYFDVDEEIGRKIRLWSLKYSAGLLLQRDSMDLPLKRSDLRMCVWHVRWKRDKPDCVTIPKDEKKIGRKTVSERKKEKGTGVLARMKAAKYVFG